MGRRTRGTAAVALAAALSLALSGCLPALLGDSLGGDSGETTSWKPVRVGGCPFAPDPGAVSTAISTPTATPAPSAPVPTPTPTSSADPATAWADAVAATEAIALPERHFWVLIDQIRASRADDPFGEAAASLAGCGDEAIVAWEARLALVLSALDGPVYRDAAETEYGVADSTSFLFARCSTVLRGEAEWRAAVAAGTVPQDEFGWGVDGDEFVELLLGVGVRAAEARGAFPDYFEMIDARVPISYETGSNVALWG